MVIQNCSPRFKSLLLFLLICWRLYSRFKKLRRQFGLVAVKKHLVRRVFLFHLVNSHCEILKYDITTFVCDFMINRKFLRDTTRPFLIPKFYSTMLVIYFFPRLVCLAVSIKYQLMFQLFSQQMWWIPWYLQNNKFLLKVGRLWMAP